MAKSRAQRPRRHAAFFSAFVVSPAAVPSQNRTSSDKGLLPLGALMLAASMGAMAQTNTPETTLSTVTVKNRRSPGQGHPAHQENHRGQGKRTSGHPQSVTVFTEKLMNDRNQDDFREVLRTTAGVTFQSGETGEEDVRLRGFSLGLAGDIYVDGMKDAPLIERDTFNNDRIEVLKGSGLHAVWQGLDRRCGQPGQQVPAADRPARSCAYTLGTGKYHRATGDFNWVTGEKRGLPPERHGAGVRQLAPSRTSARIAPTFAWGIGTRDEFSIGLYHLESKGRPLYNHPGASRPTARSTCRWKRANYLVWPVTTTTPPRNTSRWGHIHRFDDNGELTTRLRYGKYERDLLASTIGFRTAPSRSTRSTAAPC